jgi:hypothetical protein
MRVVVDGDRVHVWMSGSATELAMSSAKSPEETRYPASRIRTVPALMPALANRPWHGPACDYPLHRLSGDLSDEVVVAVVVQQRYPFPLSDRSVHQVREADCSDPPAAPERGLDVKRTPPVLIVSCQPFITSASVGPHLVELGARSCRRVSRIL